MIEPIKLTDIGDILRVDRASLVDEDSLLTCGIKWHNHRCGAMEIRETQTHYRLNCMGGGCGTIVAFPKEVNTFGKLREWCARQIQAQQSREHQLNDAISQTARIGSASDDDIWDG